MSKAPVSIVLHLDIRGMGSALTEVRDGFAGLAKAMVASSRAISRMSRALRGRRSGHRHYGTPGWRRRYAPGRPDLPLGARTWAKRREPGRWT